MNGPELELRRRIMVAFAETGAPPVLTPADRPVANALQELHVVVLDGDGQVRMAHPFAAHREGTRVDAGGRTWWGNCAWDGFGLVAALGLQDATVTSNGLIATDDLLFHVAVPTADWWADVGFT